MTGEITVPINIELEIAEPVILAVCDGMGGHSGGETASRLAVTMLTMPGSAGGGGQAAVKQLLQQASDAINDAAQQLPQLHGMGCTVVGVVLTPDGRALIFNVGDSRCYRVEGQYLAQLSVDHRNPSSGGLTQALGGGRREILQPDFFQCDLPPAPGLFLCSDGLDDYTAFEEVERLIVTGGPELAADLCHLALAGGGGDNVSILQIASVQEAPSNGR
ncbi:PP2C family protein-serine/threonine phosphatase (plasmid) [Mycolicibacterium aichiense]|uniref:PP2C family protein-serine/threonine phosphatase n=1 Tax=Mycolicibacterium aichiense TaxID=1799 RepID=UPI003D664E35